MLLHSDTLSWFEPIRCIFRNLKIHLSGDILDSKIILWLHYSTYFLQNHSYIIHIYTILVYCWFTKCHLEMGSHLERRTALSDNILKGYKDPPTKLGLTWLSEKIEMWKFTTCDIQMPHAHKSSPDLWYLWHAD